MVCSKCEKKIKKLVIPDKWKDESRGNDAKKIQNSILKEKRERKHTEKDNQSSKQCKICYAQIQSWANYCSRCAYKKGICARCGRKIQDTKMQKMSN